MTDPELDPQDDRTRRWERVPELGGAPVPQRPPVPGTVAPAAEAEPDDEPGWHAETDRHDQPEWRDQPEWHDEQEWHDQPEWQGTDDETDGDDEREPVAAGRPRDPVWRTVARGLGELLVTAGLIVLLFVVYEVYVTDFLNDRTQSQLNDQLHDQWDDASPAAPGTPIAPQVEPAVGQSLAVLHIPRLGSDYQRVILEGTAEDQLSQGPGHYVGTAMPGQTGNFAIAGHRVGKGSPFLDADTLVPGDPIIVETADAWYVYRVLGNARSKDYTTDPSGIPGQQIVLPSDISVIAPLPDSLGATPTGAYLTLTTCNPKYSAHQRLIVHAVLDGTPIAKADDPDGPSALTGG